MTLINSCCPKSFSHLIFLLLTFTITATTIPTHQLDVSKHKTTGGGIAVGYDRKNDNKRYDNLFDFKTDVNNLWFHSQGNQQPSTIARKRRDTPIEGITTIKSVTNAPTSTKAPPSLSSEDLILNLSFANLSTYNMNFSSVIGESVASLNLSHNLLLHFNASKLTKLKALDLSHNHFNEFNLQGHKTLQYLDMSVNSLTMFNCDECESLQSLKLSNNKLTQITLDNVARLKLLDLSSNELSDIDPLLFHNKSNLSDVILACNRIGKIDKHLFRQLVGLQRLDLSYNDISDIESETFRNLLNLQLFDLSFNRIHIPSLQSLQNIADLTRLSLAGNVLLRNALRGFAVSWSIMELDYSHVGLCQVPDSLAQSVRILNLYGNFVNIIRSGDFDSYPLLHKLVMSDNNLTSIDDDALGRLEMLTILYLDNNQLTQIPPSLPSGLIKLYMQNNRITDIHSEDLLNLINLQLLDISGNRIIFMPQLTLPTLITLSVKSCGMENVHHQLPKTSPNLRHLLIDGNLIKCSDLMEIEQCSENSTDFYINDDVEYNPDDDERKEKHLNSISYFPNTRDSDKCRWRLEGENLTEGAKFPNNSIPNCWINEEKLITSFNPTNDSTSLATEIITLTTTTIVSSSSVASNDNKFQQEDKKDGIIGESLKGRNDGNLSNKTMKINNNKTTIDERIMDDSKPHNSKSTKNIKSSKKPVNDDKQSELEFPVNVVKTKIKLLNNKTSSSSSSTGVDKNLSPGSVDSAQHIHKGLNNFSLMETKQIKIDGEVNTTSSTLNVKIENSGMSYHNNASGKNKSVVISKANPSNYQATANHTETITSGNLIDYVNGDYKSAQSSAKLASETTNKLKAIKNNEIPNSTNNSKSIDEVESERSEKEDNESRNDGHNNNNNNKNNKKNNNSVNEQPLAAESMARSNNSGNESIDATDHQQHIAINHTMNGEQSEKWNDIRIETIKHPGLLIVIAISVGVLFTFIVVYVYRCNFINSARRRRRRGSCESINEGRDVLNDNFNEETHSFTIETHNHCTSPLTTAPTIVNQSDLLPMDILNSTLSQSVDRPHISMYLW